MPRFSACRSLGVFAARVERGGGGGGGNTAATLFPRPNKPERVCGRDELMAQLELRGCKRQTGGRRSAGRPAAKSSSSGGLQISALGAQCATHSSANPGNPAWRRTAKRRHLSRPTQFCSGQRRANTGGANQTRRQLCNQIHLHAPSARAH